MAASVDLTTLAKVKTALDLSGTDDDTYLEQLIDRVSEIIESYCDREFNSESREEIFDGTGENDYQVDEYPISSITKLERRTSTLNEDDWDTIDSEYYHFYPNQGSVHYVQGFVKGIRNYQITYVAGYADIPDDLEQAAIDLVAYYFNKRKSKNVKSESIGDYSITYEKTENVIDDLSLDIILDKYKKIR
jgi:hypothetical protein